LLNAEQSQQERVITFEKMRLLQIHCIVATDLIARGVDLPDVQLVVNFDVPLVEQELIHRIGRAGRFGAKGLAVNFVVKGELQCPTLRSFPFVKLEEAASLVQSHLAANFSKAEERVIKEQLLLETSQL
jgi:superfamily II DNA/RNA helicase